ncbi:hypothetical protein [Helicobacter canadensis]|nr:hypothetical protein [Helicobacter canadensis]
MERVFGRKEWIKNLKSQIMDLQSAGKSDKEIKKQIRGEFTRYSTTLEKIIQIIFIVLLIGFVLLGIHIGYTILLWEANLYAYNDSLWSPYVSMLIFGVVCVLLFMIFSFWFGLFMDWLVYHKILNDSLNENFYLKLLRALLVLACLGFIIFMVMVFVVGWQISEFYGMPLGRSLFETFMEIVD